MRATVTSKGQITVPKMLREKLRLSAGDCIEFVLEDDSTVRLVARHASISRLSGRLPRPQRPASLDEMDGAIKAGAQEA